MNIVLFSIFKKGQGAAPFEKDEMGTLTLLEGKRIMLFQKHVTIEWLKQEREIS